MVPAAHVPPGVGQLAHSWEPADCLARLQLRSSPADGEPLRVVALLPDDLRKDSSPGIDEPVADLKHCKAGLLGQRELLCITGVGIVPVVIQPSS